MLNRTLLILTLPCILAFLGCGDRSTSAPPAPPVLEPPRWVATWGDSGSAPGPFGAPVAVAVAADGRVYVADPGDDRIDVISAGGRRIASWLGHTWTSEALFYSPVSVATSPDGSVAVADTYGGVQMFDSLGSPIRTFHWLLPKRTEVPAFVDIDDAGGVYCSNPFARLLARASATGSLEPFWLGDSANVEAMAYPTDLVAVRERHCVFVVDLFPRGIARFSDHGQFQLRLEEPARRSDGAWDPRGLDVDAHGRLLVTDSEHDCVHVFDADGRFLLSWGERGTGPGQFSEPAGIAVGADGKIYVTEVGNDRVQVFQWDTR